MYRAMVGVGLVCGALIVTAFLWTKPIIERNRAEALRQAVFQVLPTARSSAIFRLTDPEGFERVERAAPGDQAVYAGYDAEGRLVGLALEAQGMGYADVVRVLYAYSFERQAITGFHVLENKDTPGLGDRVESDPAFLANFEQLDVALDAGAAGLAHAVEGVKHGRKQHPWQVDCITGATITSSSVATMIGRSAAFWVPRVRRHAGAFATSGS